MATRYPANDLRRQVGSPKSSKGSETKDTPCRNIRIYGRCRYEDSGCTFNHDMDKNSSQNEFTSKKPLSVESPPFTPSNHPTPQQQGQHALPKKSVLSQAANAAIFVPRAGSNSTPALQSTPEQSKLNAASSSEFRPQNYEGSGSGVVQNSDPFTESFSMNSMSSAVPSMVNYNTYGGEQAVLAGQSAGFHYSHGNYPITAVAPQYHVYTPFGSVPTNLQPWQRTVADFFMPDSMRLDFENKQHATSQTLPSNLPQLERYHSLVPLDITNRKNTSTFGYTSWLFKAQSIKNGRHYALRRLEGYRLTNQNAILDAMNNWRKIKNGNIVTVHEAFTTREFQDSSLIFAYDFHPLSKTLQEQHFPSPSTGARLFRPPNNVQEPVLWSYICQIANAIRAIHSSNLAARCIELNKIIITDTNRIRLSACSILDVVQYETSSPIADLQQQDLLSFGKVILALATNNPSIQLNNVKATMDGLANKYTLTFREAVSWLATPAAPGEVKRISDFISGISGQMTNQFDLTLQTGDEITAEFAKELQNGRLARLMMKLNMVTAPEIDMSVVYNWGNNADRYKLRLFLDYVFHQVDAEGKPVLSVGHAVECLTKLDASSDELMVTTSPDNRTLFVLSYKDLRQMLDRAFNVLCRQSKRGAPGAN
ncbi:PAB-dependent poly(A)-specific ribonuclease subunit PAN3 [Naviculisporaceae sp. PSN 640]